jgi:hypothetical protein
MCIAVYVCAGGGRGIEMNDNLIWIHQEKRNSIFFISIPIPLKAGTLNDII